MNTIIRQLLPDIREFLRSQDHVGDINNWICVENEYGWRLAIPIYSNNGNYGFHIVSLVNVETLGAPKKDRIAPLVHMMDALLPKLRGIPYHLIAGNTRIFVVDKINGKFLKAKFNSWKNEAFLFFRAKGISEKGLSNMPIMLRIASILSSFFGKRAERMRETVEAKGKELYGSWVDITELLEKVSKKLRDWVEKFVDTSRWNSKERFEAGEKAEEKAEEKAREQDVKWEKEAELNRKKPSIIADLLARLAWLTNHDATIHEVFEIGKIEGIDVLAATIKVDREAHNQQGKMCYG